MKIKALKFLFLFTILFIGIGACKKDSKLQVNKNHKKSTGSSSNDLLSSDNYTKLQVEIQYMTGFRPTTEAMDRLSTFLSNRLNKSGGISLVYTEISAQGKTKYSLDDIRNIESENRSAYTDDKTIATYFLFLDGEYSENSGNAKVLGIAYYNTSMVIFEKTIKDLSGGFGEPSTNKLESTVINHEFGHILGLVNIGSPMQNNHQDVPHGAHCDNGDCLMNWTAETGDAVGNLIGGAPVPSLDPNCLNDLKANGGK
jgi:hypothetical protein